MTGPTLNSRRVRRYFDDRISELAEDYVAQRWGATALRREHYLQTMETLERELHDRRFAQAIEVGAGPCVWTPLLAVRSKRVLVIDVSLEMLRGCRTMEHGIVRCCAEAGRLPLRSSSADALVTLRAFEYFADKPEAVREFRRVLSPGGYLCIVTKNRHYGGDGRGPGRPGDKQTVHSGRSTPQEVKTLLDREGFHDIWVRPVIMGRSRAIAVWRIIRSVRRWRDVRWKHGLPRMVSPLTESFMVTARR